MMLFRRPAAPLPCTRVLAGVLILAALPVLIPAYMLLHRSTNYGNH